MACCTNCTAPYECIELSSPWYQVCHNVNQVVFRVTLGFCKPDSTHCPYSEDCDPCPDDESDGNCHLVFVKDRDNDTPYDWFCPTDSSFGLNVVTETHEGLPSIRIVGIITPVCEYELDEGTDMLVKVPDSGDCCMGFGCDVITTRRIFAAGTVGSVSFDMTFSGMTDGTCEDCECWNTTQTTTSMTLVDLWGGFYFGGFFYISGVTAASLGCRTDIVGSRGSFNMSFVFGTIASNCYVECETCDGGDPDDPPCRSCSGYAAVGIGSCAGISRFTYGDDGFYRCCGGSFGSISNAANINCNANHPYLDKITAADFACTPSDRDDEGGCDRTAALIYAEEN